MDFEKKLQKAIERGYRHGSAEAEEQAAREWSEDELKSLHSRHRLQLSEHIESCIRSLCQHFPGFEIETIYGERGWGAACRRDDLRLYSRHERESLYSRLEVTVRPYSSYHVLEVTAKGTIQNKELFQRQHYKPLAEADVAEFIQRIDAWVLEFAELYAAKT
jgi:hypothetical protein